MLGTYLQSTLRYTEDTGSMDNAFWSSQYRHERNFSRFTIS